jgi:hypothetical protein
MESGSNDKQNLKISIGKSELNRHRDEKGRDGSHPDDIMRLWRKSCRAVAFPA